MFVTALTDWNKERQFQGLQDSLGDSKKVTAFRGGEDLEMNPRELVVGDVMILKYGDSIPADGLLLRSSDLEIDESALTGWLP